MERLDADAFADALDGESPALDGAALDRVGDAALGELLRRLEDPVTAAELPGTGLLNIANAYVKAREKKLEKEASNGPSELVDELEVILESPLPPERKREQLTRLKARYLAKINAIDKLLEGEVGE